MITPYGAVLENNVPSPFESYQYFDQVGQRKAALELQRREQQRKEREAAAANYKSAVKPIDDFRADSGRYDINKFINSQLEAARQKAEKMQLEGKGTGEISNYAISEIKRLDALQKHYKDGMAVIEKQLSEIGKDFDPNVVRDLVTLEFIYTDDGKGGKRQRNENELVAPEKVLNMAMSKNPNALVPKNRYDMYNFPSDTPFQGDAAQVKQLDGSISRGSVTGQYNSTFQEVVPAGKGEWKVVTKSIPLERDGEVLTDEKGQPIKALPLEAFATFINDPRRKWELDKVVGEKMAEAKKNNEIIAERDALSKISEIQKNNIAFVRMSPSQKLVIQKKIKDEILQGMGEPDEEVIRQQTAWELADNNIAKKPMKTNREKDFSTRNTYNIGSGGKKDENDDFYKAYDIIIESINAAGGTLNLADLGSDAASVMKVIKNSGYKKTTKDEYTKEEKKIDYSPEEITLTESGGQMYAEIGKRKVPLKRVAVDRSANPARKDVDNGILNNDKKENNTKPEQPKKKEIKRSDIPAKAAAAGYSVKEYEELLIKNGVKII